MKQMYLTKEGILTETVSYVYLSEDKEYFHSDINTVAIYDKLKIKDIHSLILDEFIYNGVVFFNPDISYSDLTLTYTLKEDDDFYVEFKIDANFNKDTIFSAKPHFYKWDNDSELFCDIFDNELDNYL